MEQSAIQTSKAKTETTDARGARAWDVVTEREWFTASSEGVVRCPFLVRGRLVDPPKVSADAIVRAFARLDEGRGSADPHEGFAEVGEAQVLRHREIDRATMRPTKRWIYTVMPKVSAADLVVTDIEAAVTELYAMPHDRVLEWLRIVVGALEREPELVARVRDLDRMTSEHPDAFGDAAFFAFPWLLAPENATASVDAELSQHGAPGRRLLDEWVEMTQHRMPGPVHFVGADFLPASLMRDIHDRPALVRAMPTRQLHITAGNSPLIPVLSLLRAVWTKSPCTLKLPSGAVLPGSLIALLAGLAAPEHPITRFLSMVYWQGGSEEIERLLFLPGAFDRIVVWGAPDSVSSVRSRAKFTKVLAFNPRYSASFVGREVFAEANQGEGDVLDEVAARAVADSMVENQKACIASLVHYVEGSVDDATRYAEAVERALARWDANVAHPLTSRHRGQLKRLERGVLLDADVRYHTVDGEFRSGVVVAPHEFAIKDHPMCRLVVVRPVADLADCLRFLHPGVATVGVFPETRRTALRDRIGARGVSNIVPLGHAGAGAVGSAHDGMLVLSELVDWKNA